MENIKCQICGSDAGKTTNNGKVYGVDCALCKRYTLDLWDDELLLTGKEKVILKNYFLMPERDSRRLEPLSLANKWKYISKTHYPNLTQKMDNILAYLGDRTNFFDEYIDIEHELLLRQFFISTESEFEIIFKHLLDIELILHEWADNDTKNRIMLTVEGIKYYDSKLLGKKMLDQCFVAMWFNDDLNDYYSMVELAVTGKDTKNKENSDYGANYQIMKIDNKEHINYIPDEIIAEIKRSRFVIADLTGYRGGVYYEAGYADGLGLPVILTCRKDWLEKTQENEGVHFDLKQKNILLWTEDKTDEDYDKYNLVELKRALVARIGAVVGFNE